jgi:hypothetical protein
MTEKSKREEILELVNKLFVYTDQRNWKKLLAEVFAENVIFDMSSMGGIGPEKTPATQIVSDWEKSFDGIDHVYHQSGNHLVSFTEDGYAQVNCYAIALHFRKDAREGSTREFYGTYDLMVALTDLGWRINGFRYNIMFLKGNASLR